MTQRQPLTSAQAILYGTLVAGTLDILDALIVSGLRGVTPLRLFQYIAAGLLGRDAARAGGLATAFLGGFLHYFIAFGAVVVYFVASRKIPFLTRRPSSYCRSPRSTGHRTSRPRWASSISSSSTRSVSGFPARCSPAPRARPRRDPRRSWLPDARDVAHSACRYGKAGRAKWAPPALWCSACR